MLTYSLPVKLKSLDFSRLNFETEDKIRKRILEVYQLTYRPHIWRTRETRTLNSRLIDEVTLSERLCNIFSEDICIQPVFLYGDERLENASQSFCVFL